MLNCSKWTLMQPGHVDFLPSHLILSCGEAALSRGAAVQLQPGRGCSAWAGVGPELAGSLRGSRCSCAAEDPAGPPLQRPEPRSGMWTADQKMEKTSDVNGITWCGLLGGLHPAHSGLVSRGLRPWVHAAGKCPLHLSDEPTFALGNNRLWLMLPTFLSSFPVGTCWTAGPWWHQKKNCSSSNSFFALGKLVLLLSSWQLSVLQPSIHISIQRWTAAKKAVGQTRGHSSSRTTELQMRLGPPEGVQSSAVMNKRLLSIMMNLPTILVARHFHLSAFQAPTLPVWLRPSK